MPDQREESATWIERGEMSRFRLRRLALMAGSVAVLCTAVVSTAQGDGPERAVLADTKPAWTAAASATNAVPAATGGISAKVWLAPRNGAQLDALAQAVSDPSSSQYGQFITADQYARSSRRRRTRSSQVSEVAHAGRSDASTRSGPTITTSRYRERRTRSMPRSAPARDLCRERADERAPDDGPLGAGLARGCRPGSHRAHDVRPQRRAGATSARPTRS